MGEQGGTAYIGSPFADGQSSKLVPLKNRYTLFVVWLYDITFFLFLCPYIIMLLLCSLLLSIFNSLLCWLLSYTCNVLALVVAQVLSRIKWTTLPARF